MAQPTSTASPFFTGAPVAANVGATPPPPPLVGLPPTSLVPNPNLPAPTMPPSVAPAAAVMPFAPAPATSPATPMAVPPAAPPPPASPLPAAVPVSPSTTAEFVPPTPAGAHGQGVFPLEEEPVNDTASLVDSFGEPIKPQDLALENQGAPLPQFVGGALVSPAALTSSPAPNELEPPAPALELKAETKKSPFSLVSNIVKEAGAAVQEQQAKPEKGTTSLIGLPLPVVIILHVVIIALIGLAVFFLWHSQYKTITNLVAERDNLSNIANSRNQEILDLQNQLVLTQKQAADIELFISKGASFSFYRQIPQLRMTPLENGDGAVLEYGEVVDGLPISGFVMTIEGKQANGLGLEQIVDQEMALPIAGATRVDKTTENYDDKIGFSYLERNNEGGKVVYFFRNTAWASFYVRLEYAHAWKSQAELNEYSETIGMIMSSLKIYKN